MIKKHNKKFLHRKEKKDKKHSHHNKEKHSFSAEGTIEITRSGAAYLIPTDKEKFAEDIFISPKNTANALNGDTVKASIFFKREGKKMEGEVHEVIKRAKTEFVGTLQMSKSFGFLITDDQRMHVDIFIPQEKINGAKDGQKVLGKITEWEKWKNNPSGEIIDILGNPGENDTEMHSILAEFGLPYSFPEHLEREAAKIPTEISEKEISQRRDFRKITTFTIDPLDAKDFDDALSIQILPNGNFEIGVHIADVTHYVKPGSLIEEEAQKRATSVYLVDRVVPMLPEILSNNVCSLRPEEEKLCFSAVFEMTHHARVLHKWFGKTVINSDRRFTYEQVQELLEEGTEKTAKSEELGKGKDNNFQWELTELDKLAKILRKERIKKGAISFDKIEVKFQLDEKASPIGVFFKQQQDSHKLIEEFMLLANRSVAEFCSKADEKKSLFVYRVHDLPDEEKISNFSQFVRRFGYKLSTGNRKNISRELNNVLTSVKGKAEENMIETLAVRTMMKAIYTTNNIGHYGLAFDYYTHFTSPIRRYPDMMVHRLLEKKLGERSSEFGIKTELLETLCKHSSKMEKLAEEAERASVKYKQVQFLLDKVGEEFPGIISGVTEWGIFVEIVQNKCEGMIRLRDMHDDFYVFEQENYRIVGKRKGKIFQLGDKVRIIVKNADLVKKQLDFELVD